MTRATITDTRIPIVTILGNGYALIFPLAGSGLDAVPISGEDATRLLEGGVAYCDEVRGDALDALQVLL